MFKLCTQNDSCTYFSNVLFSVNYDCLGGTTTLTIVITGASSIPVTVYVVESVGLPGC